VVQAMVGGGLFRLFVGVKGKLLDLLGVRAIPKTYISFRYATRAVRTGPQFFRAPKFCISLRICSTKC
jgi:hypothetical protein